MWTFVSLNICLLLVFTSALNDLPKCGLDDPDLDNCILKATQELKPQIRTGIETVNIPAFEPFQFSGFTAMRESQAVNFTGKASNCSMDGLNNYVFRKFGYNPKTLIFSGNVEFDSVTFHCLYELDGRLLTIPVSGKGKSDVVFVGCNASFEVGGELRTHNGVEYFQPLIAKVRGTIEDSNLLLTGLFGGNEELGRSTTKLLNQNSKAVAQGLVPVLEELAEGGVLRFMKSFTRSVPYNKLFSSSQSN